MENRQTLRVIAGSLLLADKLVEFRNVVVDVLGTTGASEAKVGFDCATTSAPNKPCKTQTAIRMSE